MGRVEVFEARLVDGAVVVEDRSHAEALAREGYGAPLREGLELDPLEALYLAYRGRLVVRDTGGRRLGFEELVETLSRHDDMLWVRFTVYHDLRSRGRRVSRGPAPGSLVYTGPDGRIEVYVLEESRMTSLNEVMEYIDASTRNDRVPVLAIVDRHGDVTYYSINRFQPGG
ncbi:MAG: hypothetical protein QI199_08170 [Candidatus Korarchaeota archaeon]|nr:hypothetical protein [Candidatus Korarchaeota archaeon]